MVADLTALLSAVADDAPIGLLDDVVADTVGSVIGVDEVGRGPIAGDTVVAAVRLPAGTALPEALAGLNDSKKLTPKRREALADAIHQHADVRLVACSAAVIDEIGIATAVRSSMRTAVKRLAGDVVLVDAEELGPMDGPDGPRQSLGVVRGDGRSRAIAAASIVAKVARDAMAVDWERQYPGWGFDRHRGYPTPAHLAVLAERGPTPLHRRSFAPLAEHAP